MKNSLFSNREVESLRAQVHQLRESIAELENRLAHFEGEPESDEDPWGIWPYCYFVAAWDFSREKLQRFRKPPGRKGTTRRNRHLRLQGDTPVGELHLV